MGHPTHAGSIVFSRDDGVDGAPAPPGDDRAVRAEAVPLGFEQLRASSISGEAVHPGVAVAHAVVAGRPHVEAAELEHQEHVRGPLADAAHEHELAHDDVVGEAVHAVELDEAGVDLLREVLDRRGLAAREADAAQLAPSTARAPPPAWAARRTARRTGRGSRPRPGPRAAGSRSSGRARRSASLPGRAPTADRAHRASSARAAAPDRAARARAHPPRPSREPSPSHHVCAGTRARRRGRSRGDTASPTAGASRSGTRTRNGTPPASTVSSVRSPANVRRTTVPGTGPDGSSRDRVRVGARPAPATLPSTGASTGSTPHGVVNPSARDRRVDRRPESEERRGPLVGRAAATRRPRRRPAPRGPRASRRGGRRARTPPRGRG